VTDTPPERYRVVVAGTKFGRVYLSGVRRRGAPYELVGVLGRGSARSEACARHHGVPLYQDVDELPEVDIACVVVGTAVNGGPGADLAKRLLDRGVHVLQEHPVHHDELAGCLRAARHNRVLYRLNTHYVELAPVRRFLAAARALTARSRPLFVDAACGIQVAYSLLDIVARAVGGLRPWAFADPEPLPEQVRQVADVPPVYRRLDGVIGGVPVSLRVQNELDPSDPDNGAILLHQVSLGTADGVLTLHGSHGPVLFSPRPHLPRAGRDTVDLSELDGEVLDLASAQPIGPATAPAYRAVLREVWPDGVGCALDGLVAAMRSGQDPLRAGQYHLGLCGMWQDLTRRLGQPDLVRRPEPAPVHAGDLDADGGGLEPARDTTRTREVVA
jgi:pyochelin biosynthesis protein PchG